MDAIKMRINKQGESAVCCVCGKGRKHSLEMFDLIIGKNPMFTICDLCNDTLFNKTLRASCGVNAKLKSQHDLAIIAARRPDIANKHLSINEALKD